MIERLFAVEFGPSRSQRFAQAVALAESGPGECMPLEPGRYRVSFSLGGDPDTYAALGRLLERVRHWRATEVSEEGELVSAFQAKDIEVSGCPRSKQFREPCNDAPDRLAFGEGGTLLWHPIRPICALG